MRSLPAAGPIIAGRSHPARKRVTMDQLPKFVAAAVQASPVYMDRKATIEKARRLIVEVASKGAKLVAFPEAFVPGYPYWNWIDIPFAATPWFVKLYEN